nr:type II toxin-antitoxin system YafQ family toxin [uncultured Paludibaculum sp.]
MSWAASACWLWSQHGSTPPLIGMEIGTSLVRHDRFLAQTFNTRISRIPFSEWKHFRDCHIEPDWLLIYRIDGEDLPLVRTGTHSDLFCRSRRGPAAT